MMRTILAVGLLYPLMVTAVIFDQYTDQAVTYPITLPAVSESPNRNWGIEWDEDDLHCLAQNIYFEARSEPIEGQYAVADVVLHRVQHANYPDTICGVVQDAIYSSWNPEVPVRHMCQFSWWCDSANDSPSDDAAYNRALFIAKDILTDPAYPGMIDYALFYHATYVQPAWADRMELVAQIGEHYFYRP